MGSVFGVLSVTTGAVIAATVTVIIAKQPVGNVYLIIPVPAMSPVTLTVSPTVDTTLIRPGLIFVHVPPPMVGYKITKEFRHRFVGPIMAGVGFTLTITEPVEVQDPSVVVTL